MSPPLHQPQSRLAEDPTSDLQGLLASASELTPPAGAQQRIWQRLANPYGRIVDNAAEDVVLVDLLRRAADAEPSLETQTRIWRRLNEEASARAGLAEPRRLIDSDALSAALLAPEVALEPPYARQTRLYRQVAPKRAFSWSTQFAFAAVVVAACGWLLYPVVRDMKDVGAGTVATLADGRPPLTGGAPGFHGGEAVALKSGESTRRWRFDGVGDCVLSGEGANITVASSDEHGVRLRLERGAISIHALKRSKDSPLIIEANGVVAQVVGTILTVEAIPGGANVFVHEGLVQVSSAGHEPALISADQAWPNPFSKPPPWAAENMSTLAGIAVAPHVPPAAPAMVAAHEPEQAAPVAAHEPEQAAPVAAHEPEHVAPVATHAAPAHPTEAGHAPVVAQAPAARHELKVAPVATPVAAPQAAPVAAAPVAVAPPAAPATLPAPAQLNAPSNTTRTVEMPATPPPAVAASAVVIAVAPHSLAGPHFDLEHESLSCACESLEEISQTIARLQRGGRESLSALAGVYRAQARLEETEQAQIGAQWKVISVLDDQMGAIDMALTEVRKFVPKLTGADRSRARLQILTDLVDLQRKDEAISAAGDCLRECSPEQRPVALVLLPQLLMDEGRSQEVSAAMRLAQQDPDTRQKAAFIIARRAMALRDSGQLDRARLAALLALSLDQTSPSAAELRQIK